MAPFLSSLSHGGMARANGLGGKPRKLIADVRIIDYSTNNEYTLCPPADSPKIVTLFLSPPNKEILD